MIRRIGLVAKREFVATVMSKAFLIGLCIMPALGLLFFAIVPHIGGGSPPVRGDVAVIDGTGQVTTELRAALAPAAIAARTAAAPRQGGGFARPAIAPDLRIIERPRGTSIDQEKRWLAQSTKEQPHLALIVIHEDAVERAAGRREFGTYDLFLTNGVDGGTEYVIYDAVRKALVTARLRTRGLDLSDVESTMRVVQPAAVVLAGGKQIARNPVSRTLLPFACGLLLFLGVISGGQTLMATTVEEKATRMMEVLLSAVSPLELMWGKLLGQFGVGLVVMAVYSAMGLFGLARFSLLGLLDPQLLPFLFVFYVLTYLMYGSLMMSVGAAVNHIGDTQSMMTPLVLLLIAPYMLTPVIAQAPNSTFSVVMSFIPPVNTFAMIARIASDTPPPMWQAALTALVGVAGAAASVWFASRIFRISLLMQGKPPTLATMIRWARTT
jgi:ABC-2 type transport system permease protein